MAKLTKKLPAVVVILLLLVAVTSFVEKAYSQLEAGVTTEEREALITKEFEDQAHCEVPDNEVLTGEPDSFFENYHDEQSELSESMIAADKKENDRLLKSQNKTGGLVPPFIPSDITGNRSAAKKEIAKQQKLGAQTAQLQTGKDGATTIAGPGSPVQDALVSANKLFCAEKTAALMSTVENNLEAYARKNPDLFPKTKVAESWLLPVAMAANVADLRGFNVAMEGRNSALYAGIQTAKEAQDMSIRQRAQSSRDEFAVESIKNLQTKANQMRVNQEFIKIAVLQLEEKLSNSASSHCNINLPPGC